MYMEPNTLPSILAMWLFLVSQLANFGDIEVLLLLQSRRGREIKPWQNLPFAAENVNLNVNVNVNVLPAAAAAAAASAAAAANPVPPSAGGGYGGHHHHQYHHHYSTLAANSRLDFMHK